MRRITAVLLSIGAAASVAAAPAPTGDLGPGEPPPIVLPPIDPQLPDDPNPFPMGVCVYARPVNPNTKYCVLIHDPR
jgi:hypothetical protein